MAPSNQEDHERKGKPLIPELQIKVFEALVSMNCPIICLRSQAQLNEIISMLINDSNVTDKADEYVCVEIQKAVWRCAYIRPDFDFVDNYRATCIEVRPIWKIQQLMGNIRRLELGITLFPTFGPVGFEVYGSLNLRDATTAMGAFKAQFPRLATLVVFIDVELTHLKDEVAKTSVWWDQSANPTESWQRGAAHPTVGANLPLRQLVTELLIAVKEHDIGTAKVFKLMMARLDRKAEENSPANEGDQQGDAARTATFKWWFLRCMHIDFTNMDDVSSVVQEAWDSRKEFQMNWERPVGVMAVCLRKSSMLWTDLGNRVFW